jgi:hypothetical protein
MEVAMVDDEETATLRPMDIFKDGRSTNDAPSTRRVVAHQRTSTGEQCP